jgi:hypothetical protein
MVLRYGKNNPIRFPCKNCGKRFVRHSPSSKICDKCCAKLDLRRRRIK